MVQARGIHIRSDFHAYYMLDMGESERFDRWLLGEEAWGCLNCPKNVFTI